MNKKLQVFVSSTYTDLIEERQAAVEAILESGRSYTQLEYTYAISKNMPVVAIVLDNNGIYERVHNNSAFEDPHSELYDKYFVLMLFFH